MSVVFTMYAFVVSLGFFKTGYAMELLQLTKANFDSVVNGSSFVFVLFHAPWDERSVKAVQSLEQVMNKLSDENNRILLATVNAYDEVKLATRFWIDHWSVFKFFLKGSITPET